MVSRCDMTPRSTSARRDGRLDASRTHTQRRCQRSRYNANFMIQGERLVRNCERFRAGLEHDSAWRLTFQIGLDRCRSDLALVQNSAIFRAYTDLGFPSAEIDCNMLHGCLLVVRRERVFFREAPVSATSLTGRQPAPR